MSGAPIDLLATDLTSWFDKGTDGIPRRVLLWIDEESQFARLVSKVEPLLLENNIGVLTGHRDQQVILKIALLRLDASGTGRVVVYLPGFTRADLEPSPDGGTPGLWAAYEYRYKGCIWGPGATWQPGVVPEPPKLLTWLRSHGMKTADDSAAKTLTSGGAESLLSRYTLKHIDRDLSDWPRPLRIGDVKADLGGEPRDELKRLIMDPATTVANWGPDAPVIRERIREVFGLDLDVEHEPSEIADDVVVRLALAEAWEALGESKDFPFLTRLPGEAKHRKALAKQLRDEILPNENVRGAYRARIDRLEPQYDLAAWANGKPGMPVGLPRLAREQWRNFLAGLDHATEAGWKPGREYVLDHSGGIGTGLKSPWNSDGDGCHWGAISNLAELSHLATKAIDGAVKMTTAAAIIEAYAHDWYRIDHLHLAVRNVCSQHPDLENVRLIVDHAYFDYVAAVNDRFADLLEADSIWPPPGTTAVSDHRAQVWLSGDKRRAVIVSDALRWDLGKQIAEQLGDGCEMHPVMSTLPSITPYGMTAMLPLREGEPVVKWSGGPTIQDNAGRSLAVRASRKQLIQEVADSDGRSVEFLEMNALLKSKKAPSASVVVVFDTNIDDQGHKATENFPALAQKLVTDIRRSIEKLHAAGIPTVHVLTDHGFLMLPPDCVDALGHPDAPVLQCTKRETRWAALKPDAPIGGLLKFPLPLAPDKGILGFARGVRTLVKSEPYMHGGISLQECVLPHLVATASIPVVRVRPLLSVPQPKLTTGTVSFTLKPAPLQQAPLGGIEPAFVRIILETESDPPQLVAQVREEELRQDLDEIKGALFLEGGHHLTPGTQLRLKCVDRDTGEELAYVPLALAVEWE